MRNGPVVLDALVLRENPTGVGRSVLELLKAMAAEDRGLDFVVLTGAPSLLGFLEERPRWTVRDCPGARGGIVRKAIFTQVQVPRICGRLDAGLLHSLQFVAPVRGGCPLVVTVHDLLWHRYPETIEQPRLAYYRAVVPRALARATRILANSQATADGLAAVDPALAGRIEATPFGTPSWVWEAKERLAAAGRKRDEIEGRPYFLFVGTLEPRKNLEGLLRAYRLFLDDARAAGRPEEQIPDLRVVGPRGWKDSPLRSDLAGWLETGRVQLLGYRAGDDLWRLYAGARALLFPSLHEGFGFPILEAMAAGTPVLTSNRDAMAEVAGDCALLVDPGDPQAMAHGMGELAGNEAVVRDLARRGPARAEELSWTGTAARTCEIYRRVLGDK